MKYHIKTHVGDRSGGHLPYNVAAWVLPVGEEDIFKAVYTLTSGGINKRDALLRRTELKRDCRDWMQAHGAE